MKLNFYLLKLNLIYIRIFGCYLRFIKILLFECKVLKRYLLKSLDQY